MRNLRNLKNEELRSWKCGTIKMLLLLEKFRNIADIKPGCNY